MSVESYDEIRARARRDASEVLEVHWADHGMPVDPIQVARSIGLEVFSAQLGNDVFGMIVGSPSGVDIYLDKDQPAARLRFTCAHEIGHYVDNTSKASPEGVLPTFVDRRSDDTRGAPAEVYANEFAGSLLTSIFREPGVPA